MIEFRHPHRCQLISPMFLDGDSLLIQQDCVSTDDGRLLIVRHEEDSFQVDYCFGCGMKAEETCEETVDFDHFLAINSTPLKES